MSRWTWGFVGAFLLFAVPAFVVPRIAGEGGGNLVGQGRVDLLTVKGFVDRFQLDCGRYPTTAEGLEALTSPPPSLHDRWRGPYSSRPAENDAWGNPYRYESDGRFYTLTTLGADGKPGGQGEGADLMVTD